MMRVLQNKKNAVIFLMVIMAVFYFGYSHVWAATGDEGLPGEDLAIQDVFKIINGLACWFARIASFLMIIFIIIAGLRFMAARGDPAAFTAAKKNFSQVLLGLLVILGVYVIIATVANAVGVTDFSFIPLVC